VRRKTGEITRTCNIALHILLMAGITLALFWGPFDGAHAASFKTIYNFAGGNDGEDPWAGVTAVKGKLYGTTVAGGAQDDGTVFSLDPGTGEETVLHSFCSQENCTDGASPEAGLIAENGILYGTTELGGGTGCGGNGCGTIFSIDPTTGTEKVLYTFCSRANCTDGQYPVADLIDVNATLYGTTMLGGIVSCLGFGCGTVFSLDPATGTEKVIYTFCSRANCTDGGTPIANLIDVNGTLYGTTIQGGANCHGRYQVGCGTVFSLDPDTGAEAVLYSFCSRANCADGAGPFAGLIPLKGKLYGTTWEGGENEHGTVFSLAPATGKEKVVYDFCEEQGDLRACPGGEVPYGWLIYSDGILYGTTYLGGIALNSFNPGTGGTVFALDPSSGTETLLHSFGGGADGANPIAGLLDVKGTVWGTTQSGGAHGYGTIFSLVP